MTIESPGRGMAPRQVVVASDIRGTDASWRAQLAGLGPTHVLSPWPGGACPHDNLTLAVDAFHRDDGLARYEQQIADVVNDEPAVLIGFSVGATALWRYVASARCHPQSLAILYYGSRIRAYADRVPRCATALFFAEHEASFEPRALAASLVRPGVHSAVVAGTGHGFMRAGSEHHDAGLAREHFDRLADLVRQTCAR